MAERLEQFEKLNVDRIIYEKSKTEAIIESLEDGIILIDPAGLVTHINEVAAIILGIDPRRRAGHPVQRSRQQSSPLPAGARGAGQRRPDVLR